MTKQIDLNKQEVLNKTILAVIARGGFDDGHSGASFKPVGDNSPWKLVTYKGQLTCVKMGTVVCLNPIVLQDDGRAELSRWSYGGNVDLRGETTLEEGVAAFNNSGDWNNPVRQYQIEIVDLNQYK